MSVYNMVLEVNEDNSNNTCIASIQFSVITGNPAVFTKFKRKHNNVLGGQIKTVFCQHEGLIIYKNKIFILLHVVQGKLHGKDYQQDINYCTSLRNDIITFLNFLSNFQSE